MSFELTCYLICGSLLCSVAFFFCSLNLLGILQQSGYAGKALLRFVYQGGSMARKRLSLLSLSLILLTALANLCFFYLEVWIANLISAVFFFGVCAIYAVSSKRALKVKTQYTARCIRLGLCYFLLTAIVLFGVGVGLYFAAEAIGVTLVTLFRFVPVGLLPLVLPLLLFLAGGVMKGYEIPKNKRYIRRARQTLASSPCKKVGITGSFGKTSVKNFAYTILSQKYKVIATPASYNTPIGIAKTVNEGGLECDIFLAEMGARRVGDIEELCQMVQPQLGVITGVCNQHLLTFRSMEAIQEEKATLGRYASCILGKSAPDTQKPALKEGVDFDIENLLCTTDGISFDLKLKEEKISVKSGLLGEHFAQDIALAAALCYELGMTAVEIVEGISAIQPVPHRLQKLISAGVTVLDDSYNCNVEGAKNAVSVLKLFEGKKFVVTPGIVELGQIEEEENMRLGESFVGLDRILLVGETLVLPVKKGYIEGGGEEEKLCVVATLDRAQEILANELSEGDCVLFLNDLPDIYN